MAGFGQLLRGGRYTGELNYATVRRLAAESVDADPYGYRGELIKLIGLAESLSMQSRHAQE